MLKALLAAEAAKKKQAAELAAATAGTESKAVITPPAPLQVTAPLSPSAQPVTVADEKHTPVAVVDALDDLPDGWARSPSQPIPTGLRPRSPTSTTGSSAGSDEGDVTLSVGSIDSDPANRVLPATFARQVFSPKKNTMRHAVAQEAMLGSAQAAPARRVKG